MIRRMVSGLLLLAGLAATAPAAALELKGEMTQGGLIFAQSEAGATASLNGEPLPVTSDGRFVFGFGRDAPPGAILTVTLPDGKVTTRALEVAQREYRIQRIDGLAKGYVTPPNEVLARIRADSAAAAKARATDRAVTDFDSGFIWPAVGPISGVYGSQRILNGEPRQPHYGVDVAGPVGTPVMAPADGVVTLAHPGMYFSGATLIIDHGYRLSSTFLHLEEIQVVEGQVVRQGEVVALMGASGRVTGPHLDWRMNWRDERIDPTLLVDPMPQAKKPAGQ
ncbi:M23 family metallopeptidase [Pelagibius litoralis]|uniref:M23 family metallopeptidase n=1 Tax=Pelagibius litoralis TaxID=374515 RepID=A0A967KHE3_9PROT|nr:M23 family metallopeptidase [Pelagibius litoralis]NIA71191.1 M23 family metallopeptidase [Pelagibius litoralis]